MKDGCFAFWTETTMSNPYLPPELLDHTIDLLHDNPRALKKCCLVSKSWIPRTRKHLFAHIMFRTQKSLQSWMETFPDPFNSPAHHTHTLTCSQSVEYAEASEWITSFSRVVYLDVMGNGLAATLSMDSFVPFHGFSPVIKSIRLDFAILPALQLFDLILSFPLLEDLTVVTYFGASTGGCDGPGGPSTAVEPSSPPTFAGSLDLFMRGGMGPIACRLLSSPGGIHFRKLTLTWFQESDTPLIKELVGACSGTLESLKIIRSTHGTSIHHPRPPRYLPPFPVESESYPIDLSNAWKLEDVALQFTNSSSVQWVSTTLRTITTDHRKLREVLFYAPCLHCGSTSTSTFDHTNPADITRRIGEVAYKQWLEFDRLLARIWESHSIHLKVLCYKRQDGTDCRCANSLLPEVTRRGIADLVEWS